MAVELVAQSCPTLCDPMDCSLPGSSIHGILQKRMLEWVIRRTDAEAGAPTIWPPDMKSQLIGKDPDAGKD